MQTHLNRLRQILCFDFSTRESFPTCISQIPHGAARKKKQHEEESSAFIQCFLVQANTRGVLWHKSVVIITRNQRFKWEFKGPVCRIFWNVAVRLQIATSWISLALSSKVWRIAWSVQWKCNKKYIAVQHGGLCGRGIPPSVPLM